MVIYDLQKTAVTFLPHSSCCSPGSTSATPTSTRKSWSCRSPIWPEVSLDTSSTSKVRTGTKLTYPNSFTSKEITETNLTYHEEKKISLDNFSTSKEITEANLTYHEEPKMLRLSMISCFSWSDLRGPIFWTGYCYQLVFSSNIILTVVPRPKGWGLSF